MKSVYHLLEVVHAGERPGKLRRSRGGGARQYQSGNKGSGLYARCVRRGKVGTARLTA